MSTTAQPRVAANCDPAVPILSVKSVPDSVEYYVNVLGFKVDWNAGAFASVGRDRAHLMLAQGEQGHPGTWVWIGVADADLLFAEYQAAGAKIRHPPTNYEWAYEFQVFDPDGHVLRFGADNKSDRPLGPWLDDRGVLWERTPDGGWKRAGE